MPAKDRNDPIRYNSSESDYSLIEFMREYPDDAACLDALWRERYAPDGHHAHCPKCEQQRKFHRTKTRASYTCDTCGLHIHPMKGTIFEKTTTSLQLWFYAMYLMASTRCGISAKQLERELGVGYKTAHRMMKKIRTELMGDDGTPIGGEVEIDETSVEGKPRKPQGAYPNTEERRARAAQLRERSRATVFAAVERSGRVKATVLPSRHGPQLVDQVVEWVDPVSVVYTDEWPAYNQLHRYFIDHSRVRHDTNTIEGFFGNMKTGIRGTYKKVSRTYLQSYLNEYTWRYNARYGDKAMFLQLLERAATGPAR